MLLLYLTTTVAKKVSDPKQYTYKVGDLTKFICALLQARLSSFNLGGKQSILCDTEIRAHIAPDKNTGKNMNVIANTDANKYTGRHTRYKHRQEYECILHNQKNTQMQKQAHQIQTQA